MIPKVKAGPMDYMNMPDPTLVGQFGKEDHKNRIPYDKYFYSGQDVFVFLYPYYKKKLIPIPCTQFQVGMSQQKVPIYGAWSYRWDAVARGQIMVQGEFSIIFTQPNQIGQYLGSPEQSDNPTRTDGSAPALWDNKDADAVSEKADLRRDIWGVETDPNKPHQFISNPTAVYNKQMSSFPFGRDIPSKGKPEADYAGHQPFDIIVCFGNNKAMEYGKGANFDFSTWTYSAMDYMKMLSTSANDASAAGWVSTKRIHIENVELMSSGHLYDVSGQPLQESYSFIARDMKSPVVK